MGGNIFSYGIAQKKNMGIAMPYLPSFSPPRTIQIRFERNLSDGLI
jgi:hypothetical protein